MGKSTTPVPAAFEGPWNRVRGRLHAEFGDATFNSWLKPLALVSAADDRVVLAVPTRFMRDWVLSHYFDRIRELWAAEQPGVDRLEIDVRPLDRPVRDGTAAVSARSTIDSVKAVGRTDRDEATAVSDSSAPLDTRFQFDDFVVGRPNELAYAAARRVAEANRVTFNPLFLRPSQGREQENHPQNSCSNGRFDLHSFLQRARATSKENPAQHSVKNVGSFTGSSDSKPGSCIGSGDEVPQSAWMIAAVQ